jgi:hypothetical protein
MTESIQVQKGVLQGDPSSPLLFNICFNPLLQILDTPSYRKMGYNWGNKVSQQTNWLQYADDAALVSKDLKGAQGLTNLFETWCSWSKMEIRLDKCNSFGMVKKEKNYNQILPKISISKGGITPTPIGGSFKYLGRIFDFDMKGEIEKHELVAKLSNLLKITTDLNIRPQMKLKIFDSYIVSQISFSLRVCNFTSTWVAESLDALCIQHIRKWIEAPISSCVSEWLISPKGRCGMGIPSLKNRFERLTLSKRASLKNSPNENIKDLWKESNNKNVNADSLLLQNDKNKAAKILSRQQEDTAANHVSELPYQGKVTKTVLENCSEDMVLNWSSTINSLPGFLFNFVRKAMQLQLPTLANLMRWGRGSSNLCTLCNSIQTNKHVLSNCNHPDVLKRYTTRHNKILELLAHWFTDNVNKDTSVYVDLPCSSFKQTIDLFTTYRPDIVLVRNNKALVIELTVCHETNLNTSRDYKRGKYKDIAKYKTVLIKDHGVFLSTLEITTLGFLQINETELKYFVPTKFNKNFISTLIKSAVQSSFDIYSHRDVPDV